MAATTAALSSRVTFRAAPVRGAKAVSSKATARAAPLRNVTTRASIADLPKENKDCKVLVVGGTGYIGKFVVRELCAQGYDVTALVREKSGIGGKTSVGRREGLFPDATVTFGSRRGSRLHPRRRRTA
jgi:divinyl chlorophyllide a 8-vinyl-reductase